MKTRSLSVVACLGALAASCSFLIDFEDLQRPALSEDAGLKPEVPSDDVPPADDMQDDVPSGGGPSVGGCAKTCDDQDACTTDRCVDGKCVSEPKLCTASNTCMVSACVNGQCQETPWVGVVPDGLDEVLDAEKIFRSELASSGDRFFSATYGKFGAANDIVIRSYGANSKTSLTETRFRDVLEAQDLEIVSPVSLLPDTRLSLELNAYAAVKSTVQPNGQLVRLQFDRELNVLRDFEPAITDPANYQVISDRFGPSSRQLPTLETFAVWAGGSTLSAGIYLQTGDGVTNTNEGPMFPTPLNNISGLEAISGTSRPGAVWMSDRAGALTLQAAIQGNTVPSPLVQCDTTPGYEGYLLDVDNSIANIWTVSWTKKLGGSYISELSAISCSDSGCEDLTALGAAQKCSQSQVEGRVFPGVSSVITRTVRRQGDADNVIYQAVLVAVSDATDAYLNLLLNRVEFDLMNDTQEKAQPVGKPVSFVTAPVARVPRYPQISLLPPNRLAVSWIAPKEDGSGDQLHVRRHRICFEP